MISKSVTVVSFLFGMGILGFWCNPVVADADGPDYWAVQGVSHDDHLNLRKGPSIKFSIVAKVPSGYRHLVNFGCNPSFTDKEWSSFSKRERDIAVSMRWCRVWYESYTGWVKGTYLQEGVPPQE